MKRKLKILNMLNPVQLTGAIKCLWHKRVNSLQVNPPQSAAGFLFGKEI
ncbi:hypothetical protein IQ264_30205 [Phormidium sp. LEGE 05292]|nr:hypothetical protein [Phormidium sp. LEGE 05292]MBE9229681.1 hypothetical protein [Phormidium sp. LEGE 05292]